MIPPSWIFQYPYPNNKDILLHYQNKVAILWKSSIHAMLLSDILLIFSFLQLSQSYPLWKSESCSVVSNSLWPHELYSAWNSLGQNTGVGSLSLLQEIFPTQRWNPGLPLCRQILYQLSHKGSWRILEWGAYPFSSGSSSPRNQTRVSCIAGGFFTHWAILIIRGLTKSPDFQHLGSHPQMTNMSQNSGSVPPYPGHVVSVSLVITPYFFYYQPVSGIYNFSGPLEAWGWGPYAKKMMAALKIPLVKTDLHKWPLGKGTLGGRKKCH